MRRRSRFTSEPRRVLDETTLPIMVGDEAFKAAQSAKRPHAPISPRPPGILSRLHGKDSA